MNILRSKALAAIDSGEPFTMEFVTADRKRGTGGQLIEVKGWQKIIGEAADEIRPGGHRKKGDPLRNPNHRQHKTINIHNPANPRMHPISVHIRLMQVFNGQRILNG